MMLLNLFLVLLSCSAVSFARPADLLQRGTVGPLEGKCSGIGAKLLPGALIPHMLPFKKNDNPSWVGALANDPTVFCGYLPANLAQTDPFALPGFYKAVTGFYVPVPWTLYFWPDEAVFSPNGHVDLSFPESSQNKARALVGDGCLYDLSYCSVPFP